MEKVTFYPIRITAVGIIIPILRLAYPKSFGITQGSINIVTILFPIIATAIGLTFFLSEDILLTKRKERRLRNITLD
jgi:hypothetical protein